MTRPDVAPDTRPAGQDTPLYVYGVIRGDAQVPPGLAGLGDQPVTVVARNGCGAVVSALPAGRALGERADLLAHQRVLAALVDAGLAVLPFRFGAAMTDRNAVAEELLAANADRFADALDQVDGRLELRLKGTYVQDTVLREVMTGDPQVAELSQRLRQAPADAADALYYDRVRLGELIAQALQRRREHDARVLLERLAPAARRVAPKTPARDEDVVDAAFLIDRDRRGDFEQAVDALGAEHADRIRLRLIGPLPPYDFVPGG
ncbi:gas vesicle protein [Actinomadura sp. NBRC 104425]|uniref:GvpL/GvpF family gas vesicle protein n=1 Tax=Actinomadura sp. NBRC 104425 TaxID=3032204 RepID=UPI0024A3AC8E|nr:GvpL/GvpF family gas vesicle protein [Actinomadura sp. NBRC 104425]GLZ11949.1 gas vesicle protein [Actinomadura sp. NBRC 104425]